MAAAVSLPAKDAQSRKPKGAVLSQIQFAKACNVTVGEVRRRQRGGAFEPAGRENGRPYYTLDQVDEFKRSGAARSNGDTSFTPTVAKGAFQMLSQGARPDELVTMLTIMPGAALELTRAYAQLSGAMLLDAASATAIRDAFPFKTPTELVDQLAAYCESAGKWKARAEKAEQKLDEAVCLRDDDAEAAAEHIKASNDLISQLKDALAAEKQKSAAAEAAALSLQQFLETATAPKA
jgi:hypothetical protein